MKTIWFATLIMIFLLLSKGGIQAQTKQVQLNQIDLMKQFLGTWKCEMGKDTNAIVVYTIFGTTMEDNFKIITKEKIINSGKELFGYDKNNDKIIEAQLLESSPDLIIKVLWFTSKNTEEVVQFQDISNPENAILKWKIEFKSPDLWVMTTTQNNKVVSTLTFTREKK
jgi:hypothetical protein